MSLDAFYMGLPKNLTTYYQTLGARGVLAISMNRVFGLPTHVVACATGMKYPVVVRLRTSDVDLYKSIFLEREYEFPICFSPRTIIDVGANCGMTTIFYANQYPDATIVAIEPEPSNYAALVRNAAPYPKVITLQAALWNTDGQVEVFPGGPRKRKWSFRVRTGSGCRAITLPTLMRELAMETVDILKVDVEGAEREIFSTCNWMDKVKLLAIELHDRYRPGCSDAVSAVTRQFARTERGPVTFYSR